MHLFDLKGFEKEGFDLILSALALKVLYLIESASPAFLVHEGISPQRRSCILSVDPEHIAGNSGRLKA